jgi:hypothetical protein
MNERSCLPLSKHTAKYATQQPFLLRKFHVKCDSHQSLRFLSKNICELSPLLKETFL